MLNPLLCRLHLALHVQDKTDGQPNIYWQSRDSAMLIRGGANYAY